MYPTPVWKMIQEAVEASGNEAITNGEIQKSIQNRFGEINEATINAQINACCVNSPSRIGMPENQKPRIAKDERYDFLFRVDRGVYTRYSPSIHGVWEIVESDGKLIVQRINNAEKRAGENQLVLRPVVESLRQKRPVFHSEADFQFALAWESQLKYPDAEIRLEAPSGTSIKGRIDIVVRFGDRVVPIELKYPKQKLLLQVNGEGYNLIEGVHDMDMYDCMKDLMRLEAFQSQMDRFSAGYAVWLTNDAAYWNPEYKGSYYSEFHAPQAALKTGTMAYHMGKKLNGDLQHRPPITLKGKYTANWNDYSDFGVKNGLFRYALLEVGSG